MHTSAAGRIVAARLCLLTKGNFFARLEKTVFETMATLERPVAACLEEKIYQLLQGQNPPDTLEVILGKLRETEFVYKYEIARAVWRLADKGKIAVESGRIKVRS